MFFETIKIENNKVFHIEYHQRRFERTVLKNYGFKTDEKLENFIDTNFKEITRSKIYYNKSIERVEYFTYIPKKINSLKLVENNIKYNYKYQNRDEINRLLDEKYDEVLIMENGYLKDTSIANIALLIDNVWYTPKNPLFFGTTRERLLKTEQIVEKNLIVEDFKKASKIAFLNAMIGFAKVDLDRINLTFE